MSIDDATPEDWDKLTFKKNKLGEPTFDEYMKRLNSSWVFDNTTPADAIAVNDSEQFKDCWDEAEFDTINNPSHYNTGSIECIEAIDECMNIEQFKGYLRGNCLKYLWRFDYKGKPLEDLKKSRWYLDKLISLYEV